MTDGARRLPSDDPLAKRVVAAIRAGDIAELRWLLDDDPGLAAAGIQSDDGEELRSWLHVATDWPGNFSRCGETIALLVESGADVDARFVGKHAETPLHWAASCDDVEAIDALLDAGADIDAPGAVLGGGTPLSDAVGFEQLNAARLLVERGARTALWEAAALGLSERVEGMCAAAPTQAQLDSAFWFACSRGQREIAEALLAHGATLNWIPDWQNATPLDTAEESGRAEVADWLRNRGAKSAR